MERKRSLKERKRSPKNKFSQEREEKIFQKRKKDLPKKFSQKMKDISPKYLSIRFIILIVEIRTTSFPISYENFSNQ